MDTLLRIHLFGKLSIQRDGSEIREALPPKAQELLAYLLLYRERWHTRERLAGELWPEAAPCEARSRLRRLIWRLQSGLGEDAAGSRPLAVEADWLAIHPSAGLWLDVAVVEDAYRSLGAASAGLSPELVAGLEGAAGLFYGDLLDNWYQEWCIVERERLRIIQISILSRLVNHYVVSGEIERGVSAASRMLRIDRAHEGAHRQMMRLRYMAGDRTGALRQFEQCRQALDQELAVTPGRLTLALRDQIRNEESAEDTSLHPAGSPPAPLARSPFDDIYTRIDQLQTALLESQRQVHEELRTLRTAIGHDGRG